MEKQSSQDVLTNEQIVGYYIQSVAVFAEVSSKADIERGAVFVLGKRLFNDAVESISTTRLKLSDVSRPEAGKN